MKWTCFSAGPDVQLFFRYFNVEAKEGDLFSRCVLCNGAVYLKVLGNVLIQLKVTVYPFVMPITFAGKTFNN